MGVVRIMKLYEKMIEKKLSRVIIVADAQSEMSRIEVYEMLLKLFNNLTENRYRLYCDFAHDYYELDLKNIVGTMSKINEISEKIKDKDIVMVSGGINTEMLNYYPKVEQYLNFMAKSAGKYVNVQLYIEPIYELLFKQGT